MWRGFGGSNLSLQCNDTVSTVASTPAPTDTTSTMTSSTTVNASSTATDVNTSASDVHIYIIAGVAGGVLVAVCALSIVIFKRRRKSQSGKADITAKDAQQPDEGKDAGTTRQSCSSQGFFEVDLDDKNDDTRMPHYNNEEYSLERNGHWTENVDIGSHSDGKHCAGQERIRLKPVGKTADKDKSVDKGGEADKAHVRKHEYLTLEPQPENAEKGGALLPAQLTQGRDLHQDGHGREQVDVSLRQAAFHVVDQCARDSDPYYSEIKEGDDSLSGSDGSCLQQNNNRSNQKGDCEVVDFESDNESSTGLKLKVESLKPTGPPLQATSSVPASASLSNDDGMFMVYNAAYESADDVLGDTRHKNVRPHDKGGDGLDDDVVMMLDNVAYESSASLQNTDSHPTGQGVQPSQRNAANDK